jgi:hypothetical protein
MDRSETLSNGSCISCSWWIIWQMYYSRRLIYNYRYYWRRPMCIAIWTLWRVTSKRPLTWSNIQKMMQTRPSKHCSLWMRTCPWRCTIRIEMTSQTCQTPLGRYSRVRARPARVRLRLQTQGHREAQRANRNSFLIKLIDHTQLKSTGNQRYESFSFSKKKEKKILSLLVLLFTKALLGW